MVTFNFTYDPGVTFQQALGLEMAGRIWSRYLSDSVRINIHVGVSNDLPTNVIGGALPGILSNQRYATWRTQMAADATSVDDSRALQNQQNEPDKFTALIDGHKIDNNATLNITRANAKALNMIPGTDTALDGCIVFSNLRGTRFSWNYDYTRQNSASANSLDFLSTAIHEIGHILGFVSGVDKPGWLAQKMQYTAAERDDFYDTLIGKLSHATPLDMFRFTSQSVQLAGTGDTWIDLSIGSDAYFSVDGGRTAATYFATGKDVNLGGDGYQGSHWANGDTAPGVMDPALAPQERVSVSNFDIQAFDVIGWNLRNGLNATALTSTYLSTLRTQSLLTLALKMGQNLEWVTTNLTKFLNSLGRDRTADVETMIQASQIYEWGAVGSGSTSTSGRRWMEIFNQMASAQHGYVNFSTVSAMTPAPEKPGFSSVNWGHGGSGRISPGGRVWRADPTPNSESTDDEILGVNAVTSLVSSDGADFLNRNTFTPVAIANTPSLSSSTRTETSWTPVSTQVHGNISASSSAPVTGSSSRQQSALLFSPALNTLLGTENNPLTQGGLSVDLMGAN